MSGTWDTNGGTLNSTAVGHNDIVKFSLLSCPGNTAGDDAGTNYVYSARLLNDYTNSGNRVGLVYGFHDPRDTAVPVRRRLFRGHVLGDRRRADEQDHPGCALSRPH